MMFFPLAALLCFQVALAESLSVGSKKFTESVILGEVATLLLNNSGTGARHLPELGGTRILWNALKSGDIDLYPEYSGTISEEILQRQTTSLAEMRELLAGHGIGITEPLGFNNTYAIGMNRQRAQELGISRISDLRQHPNLRVGFSAEFRQRQDGWPGLRTSYGLGFSAVKGLDHDVAYRALAQGNIEVIDLYSTDAEIDYYGIQILEDDLNYFPKYEAVFLYRLDRERPVSKALDQLTGNLTESVVIALNRQAKIDKIPSLEVASGFLREYLGEAVEVRVLDRKGRIWKRFQEHIRLVSVSLFLAILVSVPLGVMVAKFRRVGQLILIIVSTIQTIPALALLVMMIKPLSLLGFSGIGDTPAYIALFLYSLLPIVRNTFSGIQQIPLGLQETARVLGLSSRARLLRIELPLALPSILAGVKTSLVLNIGFATLGALIGAGGFGQPILSGIRLDDYGMILEGAVPSALLALLAQKSFDLLEKFIVSPGLRS